MFFWAEDAVHALSALLTFVNRAYSAASLTTWAVVQACRALESQLAVVTAERDDFLKQLEANAVNVRAHIAACDQAEAKTAKARQVCILLTFCK